MQGQAASEKRWRFGVARLTFNHDTGEFVPDKDWDQFEACKTCRGGADINETPEGDLMCQVCRAMLPRPVS
jgi:hypothetical protein